MRIEFYRFSTNSEQKEKWIAAINRKNWQPSNSSRICSTHFISGKLSSDRLLPDFAPTLFSFTQSPAKRRGDRDLQRYQQLSASKRRRIESESLRSFPCASVDSVEAPGVVTESVTPVSIQSPSKHASVGFETSLTMKGITRLEDQMKEIIDENISLKEKLHKYCLNRSSFQGDDKLTVFYTGLQSFAVLDAIFRFVSSAVPENSRAALNVSQQFVLVLMKLCLGAPDQDLAYQFGVSQSTVSRVLSKWIDVLFIKLQPLIKWPNQEDILATMPSEFKAKFPRCVVNNRLF